MVAARRERHRIEVVVLTRRSETEHGERHVSLLDLDLRDVEGLG